MKLTSLVLAAAFASASAASLSEYQAAGMVKSKLQERISSMTNSEVQMLGELATGKGGSGGGSSSKSGEETKSKPCKSVSAGGAPISEEECKKKAAEAEALAKCTDACKPGDFDCYDACK